MRPPLPISSPTCYFVSLSIQPSWSARTFAWTGRTQFGRLGAHAHSLGQAGRSLVVLERTRIRLDRQDAVWSSWSACTSLGQAGRSLVVLERMHIAWTGRTQFGHPVSHANSRAHVKPSLVTLERIHTRSHWWDAISSSWSAYTFTCTCEAQFGRHGAHANSRAHVRPSLVTLERIHIRSYWWDAISSS
jgi:hypothetical protein